MSQIVLMAYSILAASSGSKLCLGSYQVNTCISEYLDSYKDGISRGTFTCWDENRIHLQVVPHLEIQFLNKWILLVVCYCLATLDLSTSI